MSWRSILEDQYTLKCKSCGGEFVDPGQMAQPEMASGPLPSLWACPPHERPATRRVPGSLHAARNERRR